jgi:hypothetical protein
MSRIGFTDRFAAKRSRKVDDAMRGDACATMRAQRNNETPNECERTRKHLDNPKFRPNRGPRVSLRVVTGVIKNTRIFLGFISKTNEPAAQTLSLNSPAKRSNFGNTSTKFALVAQNKTNLLKKTRFFRTFGPTFRPMSRCQTAQHPYRVDWQG